MIQPPKSIELNFKHNINEERKWSQVKLYNMVMRTKENKAIHFFFGFTHMYRQLHHQVQEFSFCHFNTLKNNLL